MPTGPGQPGTVAGVTTPTDTGCLLDHYAEDVLEVLEELDHEYMPVVDSPMLLVVDQAGALAGYVEVAAILPYLVRADPPDASDEDA